MEKEFNLIGEITIKLKTTVDADSFEKAKQIARERFIEVDNCCYSKRLYAWSYDPPEYEEVQNIQIENKK